MAEANPFLEDIRPRSVEAAGANPFLEDIRDRKEATASSVGHNAVAGINTGIAKTLGYPLDVVGGLVNQAAGGVNYLAGRKVLADNVQPFGGSESIKHGLTAIGVEDPDAVEANTPVERIVRGAGEGAGGMVAGGGLVGGAKAALGKAAPKVFSVMEGMFGSNPATSATVGAVQGGAGEAAGEIAPDGYKTGARIAGSIIGGAAPLGARIVYEGGRFVVNAARDFARPFTKAGQESLAGQRIAHSASDIHAVQDSLENGPHELIPNSKPTTFQQTGDMGLGQLERQVRTNNPDDFLQRAAEQNAARRQAIQGTQATGSPADVSAHFRGLRDSLDRVTETAVNDARTRANQATAAMGGTGSAEGYGAAMREPAQAARDAAKQAERRLWDAVDPDNKLVMPGTPIANTARSIEGGLSGSARPLSGEEREIFNVARSYTDRTPFRDVRDLRSRISAAMSEERRTAGFTPTYQRLVQLRGAVEDSIDRAVENQARIEQNAVAQGRMSAEDAMTARIRRMVEDFHAKREAEVASAGGGSFGISVGGTPSTTGLSRTAREAGFGPRAVAGGEGLSPAGIPLDEAAAQRLRDASAATRQRASTFDEGSTGAALRPGSRAGEYRTPDSLVPSKVFHPGPNGGEDVRHYVNAVGEAQAVPAIADYAAFSLRRASMRPDGSIDTAKALAWAKQHDAALAELPSSVRSRLANPGRAEEAVSAAVAARREQLADFDRSAIAQVMGSDSGDVVREVGSVFNRRDGAQRMQQLAMAARGNSAAMTGLRRAVVEHIQSQFLSNTEAATAGANQIKADAFQTFMRTKSDILAKVFKPEEIGVLRAVSSDLQRANRSISATKLPGGSNTAQDTVHRSDGTILNRIAVEAAAAAAGHAAAGASGGIAGWLGTKVTAALRDAGLGNVEALVTEAMLNPELARALLQKVPAKPDTGAAVRIARAAKHLAITGPVIGATQNDRQ